uniref:Uncharacterized protein n=1 Tax=Rhizophora mucronata TaxID=61149 RepID=A0A2P2PHA1_RHIMU
MFVSNGTKGFSFFENNKIIDKEIMFGSRENWRKRNCKNPSVSFIIDAAEHFFFV